MTTRDLLASLIIACLTQLAACADRAAQAPTTAPTVSATNVAPQPVVIDNFSFVPQVLAIPAGTQVTWINRDDIPHTATSDATPPLFDSGVLDTDQSFKFTFRTAGIYRYFCKVHPHMTGTVIVH